MIASLPAYIDQLNLSRKFCDAVFLAASYLDLILQIKKPVLAALRFRELLHDPNRRRYFNPKLPGNFVESELPAGYETEIGEHGIRLNGGSGRGAASPAPLYRDLAILVMDEATSALDGIVSFPVPDTGEKWGDVKDHRGKRHGRRPQPVAQEDRDPDRAPAHDRQGM